ncbi:hypothetical protein DKM44_12750 [Deinococcus irradiatisoli]|uniref:Uncharacterized protein n=1 Tax=Deinococcus irradiatisoli TaxID=2202254 RepID=A0A2Z3JL33_9DEIO|nr:hypothetical protein [Deinococcus irradiatisoli]AWN23990.1 hypothetical protein DKM44_12750 [Deinococcus irradiatisoli]
MKRLLLLVALTSVIVGCSPPSAPERPQPTNPAPSAPPYTVPASVSVVSLQAGTTTELPLTPTTEPVLPTPQLPVTSGASNCLVIVKRTPTQQIASLDYASCKGQLIWLDIKQGDLLLVAYGITTDNQVITTGDVEISREDGGLIVHEIGAALAPRATDGLQIWSS